MKKTLIVFLLIIFSAQTVLAGVNWRLMKGYPFTGDQYQALEIISKKNAKDNYVKNELTIAFKMQDYEEVWVYPDATFDIGTYGPVEQEIVDENIVAVWDLPSECGDPPYKARKYTVQKDSVKVEWFWFYDTCNNHNVNVYDVVVEVTPVPTPVVTPTPEVTPPPTPSTTPEPTPPPPTEKPKPPSVVGKVPDKNFDVKTESKWDAAANSINVIFVITPDQPTCKPTEEPVPDPTCDPNQTPPPTPPPSPIPPPEPTQCAPTPPDQILNNPGNVNPGNGQMPVPPDSVLVPVGGSTQSTPPITASPIVEVVAPPPDNNDLI